MEWFLPWFVAAGGPIDATERFARRDVTAQAALPRRACAVADPRGRADGQRIVPIQTAPGLARERVVDVCAVRREGERPARIELVPGTSHAEPRHLICRKIARVDQNRGIGLRPPDVFRN